jgi:hypothetical protein
VGHVNGSAPRGLRRTGEAATRLGRGSDRCAASVSRRPEIRGALGATARGQGDHRDAIGTRLGRGRRRRGLVQAIEEANQQKHRQGHDEELDDRVQEQPVVEGRGAGRSALRASTAR